MSCLHSTCPFEALAPADGGMRWGTPYCWTCVEVEGGAVFERLYRGSAERGGSGRRVMPHCMTLADVAEVLGVTLVNQAEAGEEIK